MDWLTGTRKRRLLRILLQFTVAAFLAAGCARQGGVIAQHDRFDIALGSGVVQYRVLIEPDDGVNSLVRAIDGAQRTVWVEAYFISHPRIVRALERASAQGVDVRVLLEPRPYGLGDQATRMAALLRAAGIGVRWAPSRFGFDHAKVMLLDSRLAIISTANFSRAGFTSDRDVVVFDSREADLRAVSATFRADWDRLPADFADRNFVASPDNARSKLSGLVAAAKNSIEIYAEEFLDARFARDLSRAARRGVRVRVLLPPRSRPVGTAGIAFRLLAQPYCHAKVVIIDRRETFVGSENLSTESLDRNREIGILLRGAPRRLRLTFERDWKRAAALRQ